MNSLFRYTIADNIDAFSTERGAELPYYVVQPHQVHGCEIREVTDPLTTRDELEGVDALVTDVPGVAISVRTADCIPVLLYDPVNKAIAAVHAGWRGTVQHISCKVIDRMHVGEISDPFVLRNESNGKTTCAIVLLKNKINGHKATMADDYDILYEMVTSIRQQETLVKWIQEKQRTTYVRISEGWNDCDFVYPGWGKK